MSGVLVGFQGSAAGAVALGTAVDEAALRGLPLVVLNLPPDGVSFDRTDLDRALERAAELGVDTTLVNLTGEHPPAERLVQEAQTGRYRLVVIGIRQRSAVGKMLMGSAEQHVLLNSPAPVLAVKPEALQPEEVWRVADD